MTRGYRPAWNRRAVLAVGGLSLLGGVLVAVGGFALTGPDVRVFAFPDVSTYPADVVDGFAAYSIGTTSCNRGDAPMNWCRASTGCAPGAGPADHPLIGQNLYRLKGGRFEQIGMSWLKHGFGSLNDTAAGCSGASGQSCQQPPYGWRQLGVGCTDPYSADLNGSQPLAPRSEANATTGVAAYPPSSPPEPYETYDQRIKVAIADVDPASNVGATYWAEAQYLARDDAAWGNGLDNASHRQVTVGAAPDYPIAQTGGFHEAEPALHAWRGQDPAVLLARVDLPGAIVERFQVARKVTALGGGLWHYEYAVRNHNSDRGARGFTVEFPAATTFTNVGFKDVEHHSGEPYATTDWSPATTASTVSWSTDTFATDEYANALRFATMFNFWFDANQPPDGGIQHTLDLFKPGTPASITFEGFTVLFEDGFEGGDVDAWGWHT